MLSLDVVVAHLDPTSAEKLAASLRKKCRSVRTANTDEELYSTVVRHCIHFAIVDLDSISLDRVQNLHKDFGMCVICVHRIPDERMWAAALDHGALDCCQIDDVHSIIEALQKDALAHSHVA